jgi:hypothetical protein
MSETEPKDNGVEPICRHKNISSVNEIFSDVAEARPIVSITYTTEWRRMTVDPVPQTRHFDAVCAFFRCALPVEYPKLSDISTRRSTHRGN